MNVSTTLRAKSIGYNCMMELSTRSSICIRKDIFTNTPPKNGDTSSPLRTSAKSSSSASGGLMSIFVFIMVEREVADAPIIWFMASDMALKCSSPSSPSVFVPSPPIIRSVMTFTSCSFNIRIFVPSRPTVYLI